MTITTEVSRVTDSTIREALWDELGEDSHNDSITFVRDDAGDWYARVRIMESGGYSEDWYYVHLDIAEILNPLHRSMAKEPS